MDGGQDSISKSERCGVGQLAPHNVHLPLHTNRHLLFSDKLGTSCTLPVASLIPCFPANVCLDCWMSCLTVP